MNFQVVTFKHRSLQVVIDHFFYLVDSLVVNDLILYFNISRTVGPFILFYLKYLFFCYSAFRRESLQTKTNKFKAPSKAPFRKGKRETENIDKRETL